jgi:hypothetical protein
MFKTLAAALTAALIAGSALVTPTAASAKDHRKGYAAIGAVAAIAGITGALIASSAQARPDHGYRSRGDRHHAYSAFAGGHSYRYDRPRHDCFDKPIRRWDRYSGQTVIVGFKTICR